MFLKTQTLHVKTIISLVVFCFLLSSCSSKRELVSPTEVVEFPESVPYQTAPFFKDGSEYKQILSGQIGKYGGSMVMGLVGTGPKTFNPWASTDSTSNQVSGIMFSGLIERNPSTGEIEPSLASSYSILNGGKKIIVKLRKGIKWSDGKPITAEDVIFTWNTILKEGFERLGARETVVVEGQFPEVKMIDPFTVSFETKRVFSPLLSELGYPIAPKHYFAPILENASKGLKGDPQLKKQKEVFSSLWGSDVDPKDIVVSGPFKLSKYRKGSSIAYKPNPNYFVFDAKGQRLPYLKKLTYQILPNDDLETFKFISGEVPYIGINADSLAMLKKVKTKYPYTVYSQGPAPTLTFLAFNLSRKGTIDKHVSEWFNNQNFRLAVSAAIDRKAMVDSIFLGIGSPICLSDPANSVYYNKALGAMCPAKADLNKAKQLLNNEGFRLNKEGKLIDKKGNLVHFTIYTNAAGSTDSTPIRELMALLIKEQLKLLGIEVDVKVIEFNNLVVRLMQTGDWQTVIMGLSGGDPFEPNSSANFLKSDSRLHIYDQRPAGSKANDIRPWEAEIDKLCEEGTLKVSFNDRKSSYYRIQEILWEQSPMIYLVTNQILYAIYDQKIGNFYPSKLNGVSYNIDQWYLK